MFGDFGLSDGSSLSFSNSAEAKTGDGGKQFGSSVGGITNAGGLDSETLLIIGAVAVAIAYALRGGK